MDTSLDLLIEEELMAEDLGEGNSSSPLVLVDGCSDDPFLNCDFCAFKLQKLLSRGAYSDVWKAKCREETVALKIINSTNEVLRGIFYQEVEAMRSMDHPNVVGILGACVIPVYAIVMEFMPCGSLDQLLHHSHDISYKADHVFHWASQCASGMDYIHRRGYAHADLKPANLLLDDDCHVLKVADFGTVSYMSSDAEYRQGSAPWMAPEIFAGSLPTRKSDYYSFGIILWEMITRKVPYSECKSVEEISWSVHAGLRPSRINDIPSKLMEMIESCWDAAPEKRPTMEEIQKVLTILCMMYPMFNAPLTRCTESEKEVVQQVTFDDDKITGWSNGAADCVVGEKQDTGDEPLSSSLEKEEKEALERKFE